MTTATRPRSTRRWAAALLTALLVANLAAAGAAGAQPVPQRSIPAATGCTNPAHGSVHPGPGLQPAQIASAYQLTDLWRQGYRGQGRRVAVLLFSGESLDQPTWNTFDACWGPFPTPVEKVVIPGTLHPGGEGSFDPQAIVTAAPDAQVYAIISARPLTEFTDWPTMIDAALDPQNTGGQLVDAITTSFPTCEAVWDPSAVAATETALAHAASLGVKFFAAGGDSGSPSWSQTGGTVDCVQHPVNVTAPPPDPHLGINFPGSSPYVTDVGGTELAINGAIPTSGSPEGGTVTDEPVWNEATAAAPNERYAGGGGTSTYFTVSQDEPWQAGVGVTGPAAKPDIAALAGSPKFAGGGIGTSGSSPLMAGAFALLDGLLSARGRPALPAPLNPELYRLAADPATYATVFHDVVHGSNDVLGLGCCTAGPGFDTASGLGSVRFAALANLLAPAPASSAPVPRSSSAVVAAPRASTARASTTPPPSSSSAPLAATGAAGLPMLLVVGVLLAATGLVLAVGWRRRAVGRH